MRVRSTDGVELELHDLGGEGPTVLIAHATGFCAGAYLPLARALARLGHRVRALDFRAHGDATRPASGNLTWRGMADDVLAVADAIDEGPLLAFGHSMGGAALAEAELRRPGLLRRAVFFEPIILPAGTADAPNRNPLAASARRRRPSFGSRQEALDRYASRPPLGLFRADALHAYVEHGFRDAPDGTITLKCDPQDEAATFEADGKLTIPEITDVRTPVAVAFGVRDPGPGPADFAPAVAATLPNGQARRYDHVGHFGPFQDPDTLAEDAAAFFSD